MRVVILCSEAVIIIILASSQELEPNSDMAEQDSKATCLRDYTSACVVLSTQYLLGPFACLTRGKIFSDSALRIKVLSLRASVAAAVAWLDRRDNRSLYPHAGCTYAFGFTYLVVLRMHIGRNSIPYV
jgi:hypothetical protein